MFGAEHWNWSEGTRVTVSCCTNCEAVSLTLNDEPLETQLSSDARNGVLTWEVPFKPGVLKAVGRNGDRDVCEFVLKTAGPATRIVLSPDTTRLVADGKDVCHIEFKVVDDQGVLVPDADSEMTFDVDGPGRIIGIENGDLNSLEDPKDNVHKTYRGRGLAILQAGREPGEIRLTARAQALAETAVEIQAEAVSR